MKNLKRMMTAVLLAGLVSCSSAEAGDAGAGDTANTVSKTAAKKVADNLVSLLDRREATIAAVGDFTTLANVAVANADTGSAELLAVLQITDIAGAKGANTLGALRQNYINETGATEKVTALNTFVTALAITVRHFASLTDAPVDVADLAYFNKVAAYKELAAVDRAALEKDITDAGLSETTNDQNDQNNDAEAQ